VVHHAGCNISKKLPEIDGRWYRGLEVDYFADAADLDRPDAVPHSTRTLDTTRIMWTYDPIGRGGPRPLFGARLRAEFLPDVSGPWRFGVESVAPTRIIVDGRVVLDNADEPFGGSFFGMGRAEKVAEVLLEAGVPVSLVVEMRQGEGLPNLPGLNIGALPPEVGDPVAAAVDLAAGSDLTILVVGTNDDWESEGWDRTTLDLPGRQDELIERVAAASAATVVVVNAGSPVAMPWLDAVDAVLMAWFPGQEMGHAIVDVLTGPTRGHACLRAPPRPQRSGELSRGSAHGPPLVQHGGSNPAVPVRLRHRLRVRRGCRRRRSRRLHAHGHAVERGNSRRSGGAAGVRPRPRP
jgi:beta-glucosidase